MKRNVLLVFASVSVSIFATLLFGGVVSRYIYPFGGDWIVPQEIIYFVNSFSFIYFFFTSLIFGIWGLNKKWIWIISLVLPMIIFDLYIGSDKTMWFWSLIFFVSGIILAELTNFIKKRQNPKV